MSTGCVAWREAEPGGESPIKLTGMLVVPFRPGLKFVDWYRLRCYNIEKTAGKVIALHFWGMEQKMTGTVSPLIYIFNFSFM